MGMPTPGTVTTGSASNIQGQQFDMSGSNTAGTNSEVEERGFAYLVGTTGTPDTSNQTVFETGDNTGSFTLTISGLDFETSYRVRAYAIYDSGTSYGDTITVTTEPDEPPSEAPVLSSPSKTGEEVDLAWTAVDRADSYELQRNETTIYSGGDLSFQDTGLTQGTTYDYRVRGVGSAGPGPWSPVLQVTTFDLPDGPVQGVVATAIAYNQISVAWDAHPDADTYEIERDLVIVATVNESPFSDSGLKSQTAYEYRVRAVNIVGQGDWSTPVSVTTPKWVSEYSEWYEGRTEVALPPNLVSPLDEAESDGTYFEWEFVPQLDNPSDTQIEVAFKRASGFLHGQNELESITIPDEPYLSMQEVVLAKGLVALTQVASWSNDGRYLAVGMDNAGDTPYFVWDSQEDVFYTDVPSPEPGFTRRVVSISFHPGDSDILVIGVVLSPRLIIVNWRTNTVVHLPSIGAGNCRYVSWSPSGHELVYLGSQDIHRVYDTSDWSYTSPTGLVDRDMGWGVYSPDGNHFIGGRALAGLYTSIMETSTWTAVNTTLFGSDGPTFDGDISSDGNRVYTGKRTGASGTPQHLTIYDSSDPDPSLWTFIEETEFRATRVNLSPDSTKALCIASNEVYLVNLDPLEEVELPLVQAPNDRVQYQPWKSNNEVTFCIIDMPFISSYSFDGDKWDTVFTNINIMTPGTHTLHVAFLDEETALVPTQTGIVNLAFYDLPSTRQKFHPLQRLPPETLRMRGVWLSDDKTLLAGLYRGIPEDHPLVLFNANTGAVVEEPTGIGGVGHIVQEGDNIYIGAFEALYKMDITTFSILEQDTDLPYGGTGRYADAMALFDGGQKMAVVPSGGGDGFFVVNTSDLTAVGGTPDIAAWCTDVSSYGPWLAVLHRPEGGTRLTVYDTSDWSVVKQDNLYEDTSFDFNATTVEFSQGGGLLLVGGFRIFNTNDWTEVDTSGVDWYFDLSPQSHCRFTPDGRVIVLQETSASDRRYSGFVAIEGFQEEWWDGSAWVGVETFLPTTNEFLELPPGVWDE